MRRVFVVMLLSGCSSILGIEDFKVGDGGTGGEVIEEGYCLGPAGWRVCLAAMPTSPRSIDSALNFDTDASPLCAATQPMSWTMDGQPPACFIVGTDITFSAPTVRASGSRPVVVFASGTITVSSQLDVASHGGAMTMRGPSAPSPACIAPTPAGSSTSGAGAGGAGGSFTTKGGNGGNSSTNGVLGGTAATADASAPTKLRAGCNGGAGGSGAEMGGPPGAGGGAVYLVAGTRIAINGLINASGSGGQGGSRFGGGGGGGSGGMIHLHAPDIVGSGGVLVANGGGGGEGGDPNLFGAAGADPVPNMPMMTPLGGNGQSGGGAGGNGFVFNPPNATMATAGLVGSPTTACGGGGGGGGAGYIRANKTPMQVVTSPAVTVIP